MDKLELLKSEMRFAIDREDYEHLEKVLLQVKDCRHFQLTSHHYDLEILIIELMKILHALRSNNMKYRILIEELK